MPNGSALGGEVVAKEINYEMIEHYGTVSTDKRGWELAVTLVSWDGREPKIDIRKWSPEPGKMSKGITMTLEEAKILAEIILRIGATEND